MRRRLDYNRSTHRLMMCLHVLRTNADVGVVFKHERLSTNQHVLFQVLNSWRNKVELSEVNTKGCCLTKGRWCAKWSCLENLAGILTWKHALSLRHLVIRSPFFKSTTYFNLTVFVILPMVWMSVMTLDALRMRSAVLVSHLIKRQQTQETKQLWKLKSTKTIFDDTA